MQPAPKQTERELTPHERRMRGGDTYEHQRRIARGEYVPPAVSLSEFTPELDNNPDFFANLPIPTAQFDVRPTSVPRDPYLASARTFIADDWNDAIKVASRSLVDERFAVQFNDMLNTALQTRGNDAEPQPYQPEQTFGMLGIPQGFARAYRFLEEQTDKIVQAASHPWDATVGAGKRLVNTIVETGELALEAGKQAAIAEQRQAGVLSDAMLGTQYGEFLNEVSRTSIELPKFSYSNRAEEGGALFFDAGSLAFGGALATPGMASRFARLAPELDLASDVLRQTGARRVLNPGSLQSWDLAEEAYDRIRASTFDIARIAENTGWSQFRVARVKEHIFFREHMLDSGLRRFDADPDIVNAWKRLETGGYVPGDISLLRHEIFESKFEGIFRTNYRDAHEAALRAGRYWIPE